MSIIRRYREHAEAALNRREAEQATPQAQQRNFPALGVRIEGSVVRGTSLLGLAADREPLGKLAGAQAIVTGDSGLRLGRAAFHTALAGPPGLFLAKRKAYALVGFADGTIHKRKLRQASGRAGPAGGRHVQLHGLGGHTVDI